MKIIDQLKKPSIKCVAKTIALVTEKVAYIKNWLSLSDNDLSVWNYFCCILSTSKVKCLGMRHVFAKGICNVFENKNYIFGKSDILIKVLLQNITQNAYVS